MKIFLLLRSLVPWFHYNGTQPGREPANDWYSDPLSHPALEAMCLDQLADLPFDPRAIRRH
jgi:hypothetical protein